MLRCGILILFVTLIFSSSCKRDDSDPTFDYEIQGYQNLKASIGETKVITLHVLRTQGMAEDVSLQLNNVPEGVVYSFENVEGVPDYMATLAIVVSKEARLGNYTMTLEGTTATRTKSFPVNLVIDDQLSMILTVYDGTVWTPERNTGELVTGATINLFKKETDFLQNSPFYTTSTLSDGRAYFYKVPAGTYIFVVKKDGLSNIVNKNLFNNKDQGFVTTGIFRTSSEIMNSAQPNAKVGELRLRDINVDGAITDADRAQYDYVSTYDNEIIQNVIWLGN